MLFAFRGQATHTSAGSLARTLGLSKGIQLTPLHLLVLLAVWQTCTVAHAGPQQTDSAAANHFNVQKEASGGQAQSQDTVRKGALAPPENLTTEIAATHNIHGADEQTAKSQELQERSTIATENQVLVAKWSLAVSTVGIALLVWSIAHSRKAILVAANAAEAATAQTRALVSSERAHLIVVDISLHHLRDTPNESTTYVPRVRYFNQGRSAARILEAGLGFSISTEDDLSPIPGYIQTVDCDSTSIGSLFVNPGQDFIDQTFALLVVTEEQKAALRRQDGLSIWVWGHIRYTDPFGETTDAGFIAFQYPEIKFGDRLIQKAEFRFKGPVPYTYVKQHR